MAWTKVAHPQCRQVINGRQCSRESEDGNYCHQHHDQSLMARVGRICRLSPAQVQSVANTLVEEMSWPEIEAFNAEFRKGQLYDDAGGFIKRGIGRLIGAQTRYDELKNAKQAMRATLGEIQQKKGAPHQ